MDPFLLVMLGLSGVGLACLFANTGASPVLLNRVVALGLCVVCSLSVLVLRPRSLDVMALGPLDAVLFGGLSVTLFFPRLRGGRLVGWAAVVVGLLSLVGLVGVVNTPTRGQAMGVWVGFVTLPLAVLALPLMPLGLAVAGASRRVGALAYVVGALGVLAVWGHFWWRARLVEQGEGELYAPSWEAHVPGPAVALLLVTAASVLLARERRR